jgi:hypothetical protein
MAAAMLLSAAIAPAAVAAPASPSLQEQLAITATMKAPVGALMTFQMIDHCVRLRRGEAMSTYDPVQQQLRSMTTAEREAKSAECAGLTDELAGARMDYLDRALKGQADGAAAAFLQAGPDGDPALLQAQPDAPRVLAWKKQAVGHLAEAAQRGDFTSLALLQAQQVHPEQLGAPLALVYAADVTVLRITLQHTGQQLPGDLFSVAARHLNTDQLAAARSLSDTMLAAYNRAHPAATAR